MSRTGKYEPLGAFLASQGRSLVPMSFREIERVLDAALPPSKRQRAWWSNNASNNVMTRQWLAAGYVTEQVDVVGEKVVFRRVASHAAESGPQDTGDDVQGGDRRDPIFGCMAGTLAIRDDVDLTAPADSDWGTVDGNG